MQSPPYTAPDASATTSRMGLSNRSPTPPRGSFESTRLYPSPSTSTLLHQGSMNETPTPASPSVRPSHAYPQHSGTRPLTRDDSLLLPPISRPGPSDSGSILNSFDVPHPEPSPSTRARDQIGNISSLLNAPDERPYPNFSHRSIVSNQPHNAYLPDNAPHSSESRYSFLVIPTQIATETDEGNRQIVRSPYIFASRGTNMLPPDPSVEVCP
jgi:hypothetical protein